MESNLDLVDLELPTTNNFKNMGIDPYDVLPHDIKYTIFPHNAPFPSLYLAIGSSGSLIVIGSYSFQLQFHQHVKLIASLQYPETRSVSQYFATSSAS